ncbi:MAG: 16S rRNA (guanine(527)-N(7))-methyltransferase RsmG [Bacteroidales bacterium]|nr:16S rRNA (guanine(527)-N(7))-methyltransferase RsmG [Bacteroidales bacterium]
MNKTLYEYFPDLTKKQYEQIETLCELYKYWNEKINVISRKDIDNIFEHHVLHSMAIAKFFEFKQGSQILDVGTGGGLPGIPLAILFPKVQFTLIDRIAKKITVASNIIEELGLTNVTAQQKSVEELKDKYDYIVSRAVTAFPDFYKMVKKNVSTVVNNSLCNGIIYIKGGDFYEEMAGFKKYHIYPISAYFTEPFFETKKIIYLPIEP